MKILIYNDNVFESTSLIKLIQYLKINRYKVYMATSEEQQSYKSNSMILYESLYFKKFAWNDKILDPFMHGALVDCIKLNKATLNIKSIAVSTKKPNLQTDYLFSTSDKFITDYSKKIDNLEFPYVTILNVNIRNMLYNKIKSFKYIKQSNIRYVNAYLKKRNPRGKAYYWNNFKNLDTFSISDYNVNKKDYVSIIPFAIDRTNYGFLRNLKFEK